MFVPLRRHSQLTDPLCPQELNDDGRLKRPYRHTSIQESINVIWFKNQDDDGVVFSEHFSPMPSPALALIATVV
jgi:hypothetical protein